MSTQRVHQQPPSIPEQARLVEGIFEDLRGRLFQGDSRILEITSYRGCINGQAFTGEGYGWMDPTGTISDVEMHFQNFPTSFATPLCASWKCKNHPPAPPPARVPIDYKLDILITYSGAASGTIRTLGDVHRLPMGISACANSFEGDYSGPVDVQTIEPFTMRCHKLRAGLYDVHAARRVIAEGEEVDARWEGQLAFGHYDQTDPLLMSSKGFSVRFDVLDFSWANEDGRAVYAKQLKIQRDIL